LWNFMSFFLKGDIIGLKRNACNYYLITIFLSVFLLTSFLNILFHVIQERLVNI